MAFIRKPSTRNITLESFYLKHDKSLALAEGFTEFKNLSFIIKLCRLKPIGLFFKKDKNPFQLNWFDEYGNTLNISRKKDISIIYNNISIDRTKIMTTDLYYGLHINNILKISKLAFIVEGRDEDYNTDFYIISLLGLDNYLRTYMFMYGELKQVSPLILGLDNLQTISNNLKIRLFKSIKEKIDTPCQHTQSWLTSMPVHTGLCALIKNKSLVELLQQTQKEI